MEIRPLRRVFGLELVEDLPRDDLLLAWNGLFGASAAEVNSVWDGTKAENFAGGDGSAASPFLIDTAEQLYKMVVEYYFNGTTYQKDIIIDNTFRSFEENETVKVYFERKNPDNVYIKPILEMYMSVPIF